MKEQDDILKNAIESLKNEHVPDGPSKDLTDTTLIKLNSIANQLQQEGFENQVVQNKRFKINNIFKIAASVILLIIVGYTAGRISASKNPDMEKIRAELEPQIREKLFEEVTHYVQLELTDNYVQLREELTEQYILDLRNVALEILNASGTITNNLLEDRIQSVSAAQIQNAQMFTAALKQTDQNVAVLAKYLTSTENNNPKPNELEY